MDVSDEVLRRPYDELSETNKELMAVAIGCTKVLDSLSSSPKVKEELRKHGVVPLMSRFLKSRHIQLITPMTGVVQQCADLVRSRFSRLLLIHAKFIIYDTFRHFRILELRNTNLFPYSTSYVIRVIIFRMFSRRLSNKSELSVNWYVT